jgi:hypothetical protein
VSCVAGRCEGRAAPSSNDLRLTDAHCGSLLPGNPDAATSVVSATPCEAPAQF